jgi:hypothetical protein
LVSREQCLEPLGMNVRLGRGSKLKAVHRKGTADSEEETTSEEDETCKMGGAEWKEEESDRGYYVMWDFRFLFLFRDEKQSQFYKESRLSPSLHSCVSSSPSYHPLLHFVVVVVAVAVVVLASLYLSIFSLIRIPLTTHRENGLCAVYRCRR